MRSTILAFILLFSLGASAAQRVRWTINEDSVSDLDHVLTKIASKTGIRLRAQDLSVVEDLELAGMKFKAYTQVMAGLPVNGTSLRMWVRNSDQALLQLEARLEEPSSMPPALFSPWRDFSGVMAISNEFQKSSMASFVAGQADRLNVKEIRDIQWQDSLYNGQPVRTITIHSDLFDVEAIYTRASAQLLKFEKFYHPDGDLEEYSLPAQVYKVGEEREGTRELLGLPRETVALKYLQKQIRKSSENPFGAFSDRHWELAKYDEAKADTPEGRAEGYWSYKYLNELIEAAIAELVPTPNDFSDGTAYLAGRYVTIHTSPNAFTDLKGLRVPRVYSGGYRYISSAPNGVSGVKVEPDLRGQAATVVIPFYLREPAWAKKKETVDLINEGFDEVQVYWATTQWFDSFHSMGFTDPERSTRPFRAYLYDTRIDMRDNAFYTRDTINFTTYSERYSNSARRNYTIWHELGHGMMERLLGSSAYNKNGGLSEGMADFIAELVLTDVTGNEPFPGKDDIRINNQVAYFLTNESHDDGQAYGGALKDLLVAKLAIDKERGLQKTADLALDAMRFTRLNPDITPETWVERLHFADDLGKPGVREPKEFENLITSVLAGRNISRAPVARAQMKLTYNGKELNSKDFGSRYNPFVFALKQGQTKNFTLKVSLKNSATFQYKFPVKVGLYLSGHNPQQGSAHFENEEDQYFTLTKEDEEIELPFQLHAKCDFANQPDGSCKDFVFVHILNEGQSTPVALKRFYVQQKL